MSKKKKFEETSEDQNETVVSSTNETTEGIGEAIVSQSPPTDEPTSDENEVVLVSPTEATTTTTSDNGAYTGLENFNGVSQMTMVSLYNRNIHPVTIRLSDGSELVLSPQQKTEPLEENLILDLPVGVLKV